MSIKRVKDEDNNSEGCCSLFTSGLTGTDAWNYNVIGHLGAFNVVRLSFVCKLLKKSVFKVINSKITALFIVRCYDCGYTSPHLVCRPPNPVYSIKSRCLKHTNEIIYTTAEFSEVKEIHLNDDDSFDIILKSAVNAIFGTMDVCYSLRFRVSESRGILYPVFMYHATQPTYMPTSIWSISFFWDKSYSTQEKKIELYEAKNNELVVDGAFTISASPMKCI